MGKKLLFFILIILISCREEDIVDNTNVKSSVLSKEEYIARLGAKLSSNKNNLANIARAGDDAVHTFTLYTTGRIDVLKLGKKEYFIPVPTPFYNYKENVIFNNSDEYITITFSKWVYKDGSVSFKETFVIPPKSAKHILFNNSPEEKIPNRYQITRSKKEGEANVTVFTYYGTLLRDMEELVLLSSSLEKDTGVELYHKFVLRFNQPVEVVPNKIITLRPKNSPPKYPFYEGIVQISTNDLTVNDTSIEFKELKVRNTTVAQPKMLWETVTEMVVDKNVIIGKESRKTIEGAILTFTTEPIPKELTVRSSNKFNKPINWNSISGNHKARINESHEIHKLSAATNEGLTGRGVKVAIVDYGIAKGSEVYDAVIYKSADLNDKYLEDFDPNTWYNHGTQMARYLLDFAPKTDILDIDKHWNLFHYEDKIKNIDLLNHIKYQNADIVNLSGSGLDKYDDYPRLKNIINDKLVISRSLGNTFNQKNTPEDYKHKQMFFPYLYDIKNAKGAFVTLQAVIGNNTSIRARAGSARYYTLSIIETGVGATSQAAATFSGIMAIMLEASKKYNLNRTPKELVEILMQTATDIGEKGVDDTFGHGLVNIERALNYLKTGKAPTFKLYENMDKGIAELLR
jgi:hypothetical protein